MCVCGISCDGGFFFLLSGLLLRRGVGAGVGVLACEMDGGVGVYKSAICPLLFYFCFRFLLLLLLLGGVYFFAFVPFLGDKGFGGDTCGGGMYGLNSVFLC